MKTEIVIENFDSLTDFVRIIGKRETNNVFRYKGLCSKESGYEFTLTESYEESLTLLENGYKEGLKELTARSGIRIAHTQKANRKMPATDVTGYVPHIPNAITGIPQSMITTTPVEQKAKVITILYDMTASGKTNAKRFITAGRNLLEVIMTLELAGYRVGLKVCLSFTEKDQKCFCIVKVKHHRQQSNPLKIAYPILHPSYFRRQGLKWMETCPNITEERFSKAYGYPLRVMNGCETIEGRREYLRKHGILKPGYFFTDFGEAEENTSEKLIKLMGIKQ